MDRKKKKPSELYVCTFERHRSFNAYRVHAMKLSDLFTIDRTPTPRFSSDSNLKHVAAVAGDDVPRFMGFGLFGSRIVLVGGSPMGCSDSTLTYGLETKPRLIGRVLGARPSSSTSIRPRRFKSPDVLPSLKGDKRVTWLREIQGKLYALTVDDVDDEVAFHVFDPKSHPAVWAPLPKLPVDYEYRGPMPYLYWPVRPSNIAVVGTKIFVTLPVKHAGEEGKMVYFDVAHPKRRQKWRSSEPSNGRDHIGVLGKIFNNVLVVDLEEDHFDKLLFTLDGNLNIRVSRMVLSDHGLPHTVERVAEIRLSSEQLEEFQPHSYNFVHLGGRKVCFVVFSRQILVMLTFEFSYTKSSASPLLDSTIAGDPQVLTCSILFRGSFSVKTLGFRLFDYNPEELCLYGLGGCFLL